MIQDLKNDSARWESERRKHSSGGTNTSRDSPDFFLVRSARSNSPPGSSRYGGSYGGAQGPSQYETSELPLPPPSNRDSYEVILRYPGSDAPGYSGSSGQQSFQQPQEYGSQAAHGYGNPNYPPQGQQIYPGQAGYVSQAQTGSTTAYGGQSATYGGYSQQDPPYVNVGANRESMPVDASSGRVYPSGYPPQQQPPPQQPQQVQDPRYYGQASTGTYAQPVDPLYGRSSYQTSQPEYSSSATAPVYHQQYVSETPQYENQNQTPPPRAVTSPSTSTQAQTGNSGSSHPRHHHRDRDTRDGSYSKSDRHSRR